MSQSSKIKTQLSELAMLSARINADELRILNTAKHRLKMLENQDGSEADWHEILILKQVILRSKGALDFN